MATVTTLPRTRAFTERDLDAMPNDGHRYELIDGTLVVTPAPSLRPGRPHIETLPLRSGRLPVVLGR